MTKVRVRHLCRDGVCERYTKECAEKYLREISEIVRTSEVRYRSRTWGNKLKEPSGILSEYRWNQTRIGGRMCSECVRDVIGIRSERVRDGIGVGAGWERESKSKYLEVRMVSD